EAEEVDLLQEGKKNMDEIREVGDKIIQSSRKLFLVAIEDEGGFKTVTPINMLVIALIAFGGILLLFTRAVMLLDERDKESKTLETAVQNLEGETEKMIQTGSVLRNVLGNSRDGIMASVASRGEGGEVMDLEFVLVNEAAAQMTGQNRAQMLEKKFSDIFPENHQQLIDEYVRVIETGVDFRTEIEVELAGEMVWFKILAVKFNRSEEHTSELQ